ncbi:MAG: hypothetical protein K8I27_11485 [Planctomycetes bacterium]|nr:hypothetical protein [Planctomycetota bacterium]
MNPEWLPDWWIQSAAYKWMAGPGDWIIPLYLHLSALFLEIVAFQRLGQALPKHTQRIKVWLVVILAVHLVLFVLTLGMLDGGITYYYWSGVWSFGTLWIALAALIVSVVRARAPRRLRKALQFWAQAGRIPANGEPHES